MEKQKTDLENILMLLELRQKDTVKKQKTDLENVLMLLELRQKDTDLYLENLIKERKWSQVAGYDGISCGLLIAIRIVKEQIKIENRKAT